VRGENLPFVAAKFCSYLEVRLSPLGPVRGKDDGNDLPHDMAHTLRYRLNFYRTHMSSNRTLVLYHFYEKDEQYVDNFCHFLEFGYRRDIDYKIIVSGA
jgi:hypothetical protein